MSARDVIARAFFEREHHSSLAGRSFARADIAIEALTAAGYRILGPDDVALITTALEHASFALDGVVALDDEDMGKDGGSDTCQQTKKTVDRALAKVRSLGDGR